MNPRGARPLGRGVPAALLAAALACAAPARADEPEEWEREAGPDLFYVSPTDAEGHATHVVMRFVDSITGDPLPGATAALVSQDEYPVTGLVPAARTGAADAEGWVRIRADDLGWEPTWQGALWKYVEAPGHRGTAIVPGRDEGEFSLGRARNVLLDVRDALDRPVADALIGVRCANTCGHMPDQRIAVTGRDGLAVVRDLGFYGFASDEASTEWEGWVVKEGLLSDYHDVKVPLRAGRPQLLRHHPAPVVEGEVLDADGKPAAGAHVGTYNSHRGPWTTTDALGRFRLVGAPGPHADVTVVAADAETRKKQDPPYPTFTAPPAGVRRVFRLPPKGAPPVKEKALAVSILARDAVTKVPVEDVPLVAVRDIDGSTVTDEGGPIEALPAGSWTVIAGGGLSAWAGSRARLEVGDASSAPLVVEVARNPALRVAFADAPERVRVALVSATDERDVTAEAAKGSVPVPPGVECAFRLDAVGDKWFLRPVYVRLPADRGGEGAPPVRLHMPQPLVVAARLEGPDGKEAAGWLSTDVESLLGPDDYRDWEPESTAKVRPEASAFAEDGAVEVVAVPEGRALAPRVVRVPVPAAAADGARIDAGTVRLDARGDRRLTVVWGADAAPVEGGAVVIVRDGLARACHPADDGVCDPALLPLAQGDEVIVPETRSATRRFARPVRRRLEGPGPWTIRADDLPATSVTVDATDQNGKALDAVLVVDGHPVEGIAYEEEGKRVVVEVAGLSPGPHRLAVAAANRLTRLYRVVLKEGEHRKITARLRPAPPLPSPPK